MAHIDPNNNFIMLCDDDDSYMTSLSYDKNGNNYQGKTRLVCTKCGKEEVVLDEVLGDMVGARYLTLTK